MTGFRKERIEIVTPEGVHFGLPLAGPVVRLIAWIIDALLIGAGLTAASRVLRLVSAIGSDWYAALIAIAFFVISVGYQMFFEWRWSGQTPGKRLMRLRVVDAEGLMLEFHQIAIRNLMRVVDSLPVLYLVGGAAALISPQAQRLGDMAANTVVIRQDRLAPVNPEGFGAARYNSLLAHPYLIAVLRQRLAPALIEVAIEAIGRRGELSAEAQARVFGELAGRFRTVAKIPEEIVVTLTEEQLVRNVLQVVTSVNSRERASNHEPNIRN